MTSSDQQFKRRSPAMALRTAEITAALRNLHQPAIQRAIQLRQQQPAGSLGALGLLRLSAAAASDLELLRGLALQAAGEHGVPCVFSAAAHP